MKTIIKNISVVLLAIVAICSCSDDEELFIATAPDNGSFLITPSSDNIVLKKEGAEEHIAITFSWGKSLYGIETPVKYTIQIDSLNGDFFSPIVRELIENEKAFTDSEMNFIAQTLKLVPDVAGQIKVRLKANLQHDVLPVYSKIETISVTPFDEVNLKYPMPVELYIQGDAVVSNWGYPIPNEQQMVQIDNHRFGLIVELTGGKNFAFITSSAAWSDPSYNAATSDEPLTGGDFIPSGSATVPAWGGTSVTSPASSGAYQIIIDFATGTYSVTPAQPISDPPAELYLIGDATPLGWSTDASQKFTKIDEYTFSITIPLIGGKVYDFITGLTWSDPAYKAKTPSEPLMGGNFIASGSNTVPAWGGHDIVAPESGTYTITVSFKSGTYVLTLT